ncbi:MAG: hypothetical protein WC788_00340 [Candidatus Paceibacterota bacterium]
METLHAEKETENNETKDEIDNANEAKVFPNETKMAEKLSSDEDLEGAKIFDVKNNISKEAAPVVASMEDAENTVIGNEEGYRQDTDKKIREARETLSSLFDNAGEDTEKLGNGKEKKRPVPNADILDAE